MRMARAVRAYLRTWWPEGLFLAVMAAVALAGQPDDPLFAIFCTIVCAIGWGMGFRHRHRPIIEVIRRMDAKLDDALAQDDRPVAEVRHLHSV
jgi:hypothetical protein